MTKPKNLLIVRTDRIGDLILTVPVAEIIKRNYPDCKITFLVRDYTKNILFNHPFIDEIITIKTKSNKTLLYSNYKFIRELKFDTAVVVSPNFKLALIIFLSKIKNRVGTGYRWYSFLFNKKVFVHRKYAEKHELEFNVELLEEIGIVEKVTRETVNYSLRINENSQKRIDELLNTELIDKNKPLVIVHPGSGGSSVDLPIKKYEELIKKITANFDAEVILTGDDKEKDICRKLKVSPEVFNFAGRFNISELTALINKCDLFISNSTGPLHIASALNKNVIGFYPNLKTCSPKRWGPYGLKSKVFTPLEKCENCEKEQCSSTKCMNNIDINNVIDYIKKLNLNLS